MCDIVKSKNFNPALLEFSEVKTNKYGGKAVYIRYNGGKFRIQTPKMTLPFGLNEDDITDPKTNEVTGHKYSVNLSFRDMDRVEDDSLPASVRNNAKRLQECHTMFNAVDSQVVKEASKNSMSWLKMKSAQEEVVKALFNDTLKVSRDKVTQEPDGKWPDTVRCKIPFYDGVFKTEVYSEDREEVDLREYIVNRAETVSLLECTGIWFAGSKFGIGWKLVQMQVLNRPSGVSGYSFLPDSDAEDSDDEEPVVTKNTPQVANDDDSDNDDDENDENDDEQDGLDDGVKSSSDEEEPPPPPPSKKKRPKN
jgi:hypothetical protein